MNKVKRSLKYLLVFLTVFLFFSQALAESAGQKVTPRSKTQKLQVDGRVLLRFSQSQNDGKTIYGDPGDGFIPRKIRVKFHGNLDKNLKYMIHLRADRGSNVELWDAFVVYKANQFPVPVSIKAGLFKNPVSMSYLKPGPQLWFPERPVSVNKLTPVWRDTGVQVDVKVLKNVTLVAAILNGEGWTNTNKIYNADGKWLYVAGVDAIPVDNEMIKLRVRATYETGYDSYSKLIYTKYTTLPVKRNLIDVEAQLKVKNVGLILEGGYAYDNPDYTNSGKATGFYIQGDYQLPMMQKLHLIARYSTMDPNDKVDDTNDVSYYSFGFYYLIKGWNSAIRADYVIAKENHGTEVDNNLFCLEYQLLF